MVRNFIMYFTVGLLLFIAATTMPLRRYRMCQLRVLNNYTTTMRAGISIFNTYLLLSVYYHLQLGDSQSRSLKLYALSLGGGVKNGKIG